jgi:hypothetical protein
MIVEEVFGIVKGKRLRRKVLVFPQAAGLGVWGKGGSPSPGRPRREATLSIQEILHNPEGESSREKYSGKMRQT